MLTDIKDLSLQHIQMRLTFLSESKIYHNKELGIIADEVRALNREIINRKVDKAISDGDSTASA